jgi:putative membrane-bound dehydrogenase-like protein
MSRFVIGFILLVTGPAFAAEPKVLDDRLKLELFAEQPQIVTPTGIDVDHLGRVWAIESHTHFPPEGYQGHPTDRVLILEDTDGDGKADKITPFADGLTHAMSVVVQPVWLGKVDGLGSKVNGQKPEVDGLGLKVDGQKAEKRPSSAGPQRSTINHQPSIFLATRKEILLLRDTDGDLKADERTTLVRLDTPGNYPHNGLAGIAFDALGWMFFGFGENLGADYKLIGSDGVTLSGGSEGGNMYRCRPDGTKLERWATGFWNPHASCFDAFGRLFTVDNDPDSRPPCRLLHIIPGGDYGYRFRNGRKGTHPFTSWNGELPGTLPMVSGTGEAPSGILCYESDGFPDDYLGSWGDHRIDQFVLEPKGASFVSKPKPIVQGDENFRPVGLALAPDGSVYFTDWVLRDYKLHGKGRVWRLSTKSSAKPTQSDRPVDEMTLNRSQRLVDRRMAARQMAQKPEQRRLLIEALNDTTKMPRPRVEALWALSVSGAAADEFLEAESERGVYLMKGDEVTVAALRLRRELPANAVEHQTSPIRFGARFAAQEPTADQVMGAWIEQYRPDFMFVQAVRAWVMLLESTSDPFLQYQALHSLDSVYDPAVNTQVPTTLKTLIEKAPDRAFSLYFFLHLRRRNPRDVDVARVGLLSDSAEVRFAAVQWIGEERLTELRPKVENLLNDPQTTPKLLLASLATLSRLDGVPASEFEKTPPTGYALAMVTDASKPAALRATALRMLPPATPELPTKLLLEFLQSGDATLQMEAVRTLMQSPRPEAVAALAEIVANPQAALDLRADAIVALSAMGPNAPESSRIDALLLDGIESRLRLRDPTNGEVLQLESIRAVRNRVTEEKFRSALEKARETANVESALREAIDFALAGKNDSGPPPLALDPQPSRGRRVFFSPHGPNCAKCHTVHGRGGQVGPDLSVIVRTMNREKLYDSIVNPSKEVSPQYLTWVITTTGGKTHTGIIVSENGGGDVELGDAQGNVVKVPRKDIEERTPSPVSVMPQGLHQRMTPREFAEVISYLETLK